MNFTWQEWLGYLASFIVLISLLMSSIIKLRWINLIGSGLFALYGFLIGALPVGFMNLGILVINIYYLIKIYGSKDQFKIMPIERHSPYLSDFLNFYRSNIERYLENSQVNISQCTESFYILRNMVPAGIILGSRYDHNTFKVDIDFVIPQYRDFKIGTYIFEKNKAYFTQKGYSRVLSFSTKEKHIRYLTKMGFEPSSVDGQKCFIKKLE